MAVDPATIALSIPIVAILAGTLVKIAKVFAPAPRADLPPGFQERFDAMEQDLAGLRQELSETQERLDFTERLLASAKEQGRLGSS
jgi:hypothetical protein